LKTEKALGETGLRTADQRLVSFARLDGKYGSSFSKMAESTDEVKGQFLFCSLCRLNHDQGRKHIYTRKHKTLLGKILMKFGKKVW